MHSQVFFLVLLEPVMKGIDSSILLGDQATQSILLTL